MAKFLAFFLPLLVLQLSPILLPLIGWVFGTLRDLAFPANSEA
ncbi:hypothetical protein [Amycolatopsis palatopharyngis]|nr:hypothetical protein [Amycolatopsis palatopharyngis]